MKTRHLILIGLTILLWFSFRFLLPLTLPFVLAYFFAKLVSPMIQFLVNKLKWRRKVCTDPQMLDQKSNDWRSIFLWLNIVLNLKRK